MSNQCHSEHMYYNVLRRGVGELNGLSSSMPIAVASRGQHHRPVACVDGDRPIPLLISLANLIYRQSSLSVADGYRSKRAARDLQF
jgi:hypothetical protein